MIRKSKTSIFAGCSVRRICRWGPGAFAGGLLTACVNGQVFLLDAEARGDMAKPLQPVLKDVNTWDWRTPVAVDDKLAVLSDGDKRLMAIRVSNYGDKALTEAAAATTKNGLVSPLAVLGKVVFVVAATRPVRQQPAEFRIARSYPGQAAGPGGTLRLGAAAGGQVGARGHREGRLFAIDEQRQVVWQSVLGYGPLAGVPFLSGERDVSLRPQRHGLADLRGRRQGAGQG